MEAIIFILVMIFIFVNSGKNGKKKGGKAAPKARASGMAEQAEALMEELGVSSEDRAAIAKAMKQRVRRGPAPAAAPAAPAPAVNFVPRESPAQGVSRQDEEGCVGGSMPHDHHEGERRDEHRRHVAAAAHREAEATLAAQTAAELENRNLRRLRQAVVMAEVLGKPRALQAGRWRH